MRKLLVVLLIVVGTSAYGETWGQFRNRFDQWYRDAVIKTLSNKLNDAIQTYNDDETEMNARNLYRRFAMSTSYWQCVMLTAEQLHSQFGSNLVNYLLIYDNANDLQEYYFNRRFEFSRIMTANGWIGTWDEFASAQFSVGFKNIPLGWDW
jgi:hypothetical protein